MRRKIMTSEMTLQMLKRMEEKDQAMWDPPTVVEEEEMEQPKEDNLLRLLKEKGFDPCYTSEEPINVAKSKHAILEPHANVYPEN